MHIRGLLVDYRMDDWGDHWRRTSTRRDDTGCEVVFVEELRVLRRARSFWYIVFAGAKGAAVAAPLLWLAVFWFEARLPGSRIGEI